MSNLDISKCVRARMRPIDLFNRNVPFTHLKVFIRIMTEKNMLERGPQLCPRVSPKEYSTRKLLEQFLYDSYTLLAPHRFQDIVGPVCTVLWLLEKNETENNETENKSENYQGGVKNYPVWETLYQQREMLIYPKGGDKDDKKVPYTISSTILKTWRMYFNLLDYMNHPTPELTLPMMEKQPSKEDYGLVQTYWQMFAIYI
jgi:hypothetical protein